MPLSTVFILQSAVPQSPPPPASPVFKSLPLAQDYNFFNFEPWMKV
jgi:hypothetical protein